MQRYSPFDKDIRNLQPPDLTILRDVHEGWYVEYKSQMVKASALAKSLSAFANTYGGWLFIGVQEQSGDNTVADEFPGIPVEDVDDALQSLRHSASDHLNPTPFFETTVLRGPCDENGLAEGKAIIAVEIPQSHTAPHIHKDGRIYRRVADGSEPKPETDRFVLDQLWRRAEPLCEMTRKWIERDPEFSQAEEEMPYVRLLLCVDPWRQRDPWLDAPLSEIRRILTSHALAGIPSVPFDTVHTTAGGLIARQLKGNDPHNYVLTWRIRRNLSCDIALPLPFYTPNVLSELIIDLDGYDNAPRFIGILKEYGYPQPRIADLNFLMNTLIGIVSTYRCLLKLADAEGKFYFKARVLNAWRMVPFVDIETVLSEFKEHGLPMMMERTVTVPSGDDPNSFALIDMSELEIKEIEYKEQAVSAVQASYMFVYIAQAFGVPVLIEGEIEGDEVIISYSELKAAGERAMTVQQNRNERRAEV